MMGTGQTTLIPALEYLGWPPDTAADLALGAHIVQYERRATIFHAGEAADLAYILLNGEVKLHYGTEDGTRLLVSIARSGQLLGLFAPGAEQFPGSEHTQLFTAQAFSRCKVAIISGTRVAQALQQLPHQQLVGIIGRLNGEWTRLCCRLLAFLNMTVRSRLAYAIAEIVESFGIVDSRGKLIPLPLSHEDFAELVAASRPMVSKHLKELVAAGLLTKQHGRYVVLRQDHEEEQSAPSVQIRTIRDQLGQQLANRAISSPAIQTLDLRSRRSS